MLDAKGIIPALVSPFSDSGSLNVAELRRLVGFLKESGIHGLFVASNAGEFYSLSDEEKVTILKTCLEVSGGSFPIYFGSGAITTSEAVRLTKTAESLGASAVSVITPYLVKCNDDELFEHYKAICESTKLPVLLYNNPAVTGLSISTKLAIRLSKLDNLRGIKDSSGNFAQTLEFLAISKEFQVLAGRDGLILSTLLHGGSGAISSVSCAFPELALGIYNNYVKGDLDAATSFQLRFARLRQTFELGTFPSVIKKALELRGFKVGRPRAPVAELDAAKTAQLKEVIKNVEAEAS